MNTPSLLSRLANRTIPRIARVRPQSIPDEPMPSIVEDKVVPTGTDVLNYVRQEYKYSLNTDNRWSLFDRNSPNCIPAGSIVTVQYKECLTGGTTSFTGFLVALRRHAATPTILVRADINGTAVEQVFSVFSPAILNVKCDRKATCLYGRKVYWLRDNPKWQSRFFTSPDQKVTIKKVKARNKEIRAKQEQELAEKQRLKAERRAARAEELAKSSSGV